MVPRDSNFFSSNESVTYRKNIYLACSNRLFRKRSVLLFYLVLNDDEEKILVRGNHDFLPLTSNSEEGEIIKWINVSNNTSRFLG